MNLSRVQCSLILGNEISRVATVLRQNARFDSEYDEPQEDLLVEEFVSLQQKVLYAHQWEVVDPFEYVAPFLDVIRSESVGAHITTIALAALGRLLTANVLPAAHHNSAQTLKQIVAALETCRFQTASNAEHEAVVTCLVQVFAACVCADVGVLLNADDVIHVTTSIWKWCEYAPASDSILQPSGIFIQSVRQSLQQLISCLFSRLRTCRVFLEEIPVSMENGDGVKSESAFNPANVPFNIADDTMIASLCCGLDPFHEILSYCTVPMREEKDDEAHANHILFVAQMLHTAIAHSGEILAEYAPLLAVIRCEVFPALSVCLRRTSLRVHASVYQIVFAMYKLFGDSLLLQIECFFQTSLLKLCEGRGCPVQEHQEIALEALLDFCGYPGFLRDIYLNLDCRIERSNLFDDIISLLSKTAFPIKSPLCTVHMISMEGLLAILLTLSSPCGGEGIPMTVTEAKLDLNQYVDIWSDLMDGHAPKLSEAVETAFLHPDDAEIALVRLEKDLKRKISLAVDHFNRDFKKGFQYLKNIKLLPRETDSAVIAHFLRSCPNLNSHVVGDMLGDADEFYQEILARFTETFDFTGKTIDLSLRSYFDTFKVPGEAQKIDRVVTHFSKVYFTNQTDGVFYDADAVHVLAYSIIMLNTDLHKPEIKNKMTQDQFVRNNRGINNGEDFPKEMLEQIYQGIKETPMRIGDHSSYNQMTSRWQRLSHMSTTPRGQKVTPLKQTVALDKDMFILIWGPAVAAISVILDQTEDPTTTQTILTGLKLAAKIAYFHGIDETIDSLVVTLFKSSHCLSPHNPKPLIVFGRSEHVQLSTEAAFFIANKYTNSLGSSGWRSVMDCVIRLNQLGILPPHFWEDETDSDGYSEPTFEISTDSVNSAAGSGVSAALWPWSKSDIHLTEDEQNAQQNALRCIQNSEIRVVFRDTKFLRLESLLELIRAICASSNADDRTAMVCLDLVFYITLRNRDRIQHVWPEIETHLERILNTEPKYPTSIIEAAVFGILRVCQRCLTRKGLSEIMLRILEMVPNIGEDSLIRIADRLAVQIQGLIKLAAPVIAGGSAWDNICRLLRITAKTEYATHIGRDTIVLVARNGEHVTAENFISVLETLRFYDQDVASEEKYATINIVYDMITSLTTKTVSTPRSPPFPEDRDAKTDYGPQWHAAFSYLKQLSTEREMEVRNHAVMTLQRCANVGESLCVPFETWKRTLRKDVMDLVTFLVKKQTNRDYPECDKTLRMALKIMTKTFLQFLTEFNTNPDFPEIWMKILYLLQQSCTGRDDELADAVPEETKNLLLVMHQEGILTKTWTDENGMLLWDATWRKAREISFSLKPEVIFQ